MFWRKRYYSHISPCIWPKIPPHQGTKVLTDMYVPSLGKAGSCRGVMEMKTFSRSVEWGHGLNVPKPNKAHSTEGAKQGSKAGGQNPPCWCCWVRWGYLLSSLSPPGDSSPGNHREPERAPFQFHHLWEQLVAKKKKAQEKMRCSMFIIISVIILQP